VLAACLFAYLQDSKSQNNYSLQEDVICCTVVLNLTHVIVSSARGILCILDVMFGENCVYGMFYRIWAHAIKQAMNGPGKVWIKTKRFDSFAPERNHCTATWYVIYHLVLCTDETIKTLLN